MLTLSVVVPATDHPATLERCLAAIRAAHDGPDEVLPVVAPATLTASEARNAGVARSTGDVVVFVDADVEVHPDVFTRIRRRFTDDHTLTAVHGSYDDRPDHRGTVSAFRNLLHHHVHQVGAGPAETFWTGLGAVRRAAFQAVDGFDAVRYPHPSIEDIELGHRLLAAGARLELDPSIQGTHLKRWTVRSMLWTDFARRGVPWVALQARSGRIASSLNMSWRHRFSAALCVLGLLALVTGMVWITALTSSVLLVANRAFYGLLLGRMGVGRGTIGVGLHWLHHVVAVAAVPVGLAVALTERRIRTTTPADGESVVPSAVVS